MTLKEILLQELENADDAVIAETIGWIRSRKAMQSSTSQIPSGSPILREAKLGDLLQFAGSWVGDDFEECLEAVYATRSRATVDFDTDLAE